MPVRISQVAAKAERADRPAYRARSRSCASKLPGPPRATGWPRPYAGEHLLGDHHRERPRHHQGHDRRQQVATAIPAPHPSDTASTVVPPANSLPSPATRRGGGPPPGPRPPPWPSRLAPQTRFPPVPAMCTSVQPPPPFRPPQGSGAPLEGMPAAASTARTLEASSGVRKFPQPPPRHPGGRLPDPRPSPDHPTHPLGSASGLPTMFPRPGSQLEIGRHRLVWSMPAPATGGFGVHPHRAFESHCLRSAPLAQRIEHQTTDLAVGGSNPSRRAPSAQVSDLGCLFACSESTTRSTILQNSASTEGASVTIRPRVAVAIR